MNFNYKKMLELFSKGKNSELFHSSLHGLERECLRVDHKGVISQKPHPKSLGSALTNPYITTDFSEAQLELITPPFPDEEASSNFLKAVHCFINQENPDELIWPFSMPCKLPKNPKDVPIAQYGESTTGRKKTIYREGLAERYGSKMQTVSGTHYNFSFSPQFWEFLYKKFARKNETKKEFISESYLHMMRNFLRYSWINTYLFGAAPAIDKSYLKKKPKQLKRYGWNTYYGPYATSLRMSNIGYYSKAQSQLAISYNSLNQYIEDMTYALNTRAYEGKNGLNQNILQIENEHYSRIRPKQTTKEKETPLKALKDRGIQYVEVRAIDINPYQPIGIAKHQIRFLFIFLTTCLFKTSPAITPEEAKIILENQNNVALYGRKENLKLKTLKTKKPLKELAKKILDEMSEVAKMLGERFEESLKIQYEKIDNPQLLSSAKLLKEMKESKKSYLEFGLQLAKKNKEKLSFCKKTSQCKKILKEAAEKSLKDQENIELIESSYAEGFEDFEISSQMLIQEAKDRGIEVEVLDRKTNFFILKKGKKTETIKQATFTEKDSVIGYWISSNKFVQKKLMAKDDISVPIGEHFYDKETAIHYYDHFKDKKLVVKPTNTNYGIGISFVEPHNNKEYEKAVKLAFEHDSTVIVEEFISGREFRFLVIGDETVSVVERQAANVIGDGEHNIEQLVERKNADPRNFKFFKGYAMKIGEVEKEMLARQGMTVKSIPKKGHQVFLRENSNVSTGGDALEFTDQVHNSYKEIAVRAAHSGQTKICGVDMIIKDISKPAKDNNYGIIEINYNPSLHIHKYVISGKTTNVAAKVLDFLDF